MAGAYCWVGSQWPNHNHEPVMKVDLPLYTTEQTRRLDRTAIEQGGIPGYTLMQRAGAECFRLLRVHWPEARQITVLCGSGNNGGDGWVIARLARDAGLSVTAIAVGDSNRITGDAAKALADWGSEPPNFELQLPEHCDVLIDALLGTGLDRELAGKYRAAVEAINSHPAPVLAVDVPTGINADTGAVMGRAVRAKLTVSFIGRKRGLYTAAARDHTGQVIFDDLQVPTEAYAATPTSARLLRPDRLVLPQRRLDTHKGSFGSVLIVGGAEGMTGAAQLAGEAALRAGAGLVKVGSEQPINARAELMTATVAQPEQLDGLMQWASVAAVGPGLGLGDWSRDMFAHLLASALPVVVDADGLNLLAEDPVKRGNWILTPHPAEAARLLSCDTAAVQADRFAAAQTIASDLDAVCVLKGAGTIIANAQGDLRIVDGGNPGMATAGMGDVLTGIIAGAWGQGLGKDLAADWAASAHAAAADRRVIRSGPAGLLAQDVIDELAYA